MVQTLLAYCGGLGAAAPEVTPESVFVWSHPRLCSPQGLKELRRLCRRQEPARLLVGGCAEVVRQDLFGLALRSVLPRRRLRLLELSPGEPVEGLLIRATQPQAAAAPKPRMGPEPRVVVVGGGVGGCQAALDLADSGIQVTLVERDLSIGGIMAKLDKTFPTLDCSICILGPRLAAVASHPNIDLVANATIAGIKGHAGDFKVELSVAPRFVDMSKCSGCGRCMEVCPVVVPSSWNLNMKATKCIHIAFEQSVPLRAAIQRQLCIECKLCAQHCERQAIDFNDQGRRLVVGAGAIVIATGVDAFDPGAIGAFGYGRIPGVITNLEFERLVCATGPTGGLMLGPDGKLVEAIGFIQCVGSRNRRYQSNCSGYCCTASIKEAMLAREHNPGAEITIFYNDIRTAGKGFEELYQRAQQAGIRFVKGIPAAIEAENGRPCLVYEDVAAGGYQRLAVDLAVLAVALVPRPETLPWAAGAAPQRDEYGYYRERDCVLHPLEATLPGVYLVGTCRGPKDIAETTAEASGVAAKIMAQFGGSQTRRRGQGRAPAQPGGAGAARGGQEL